MVDRSCAESLVVISSAESSDVGKGEAVRGRRNAASGTMETWRGGRGGVLAGGGGALVLVVLVVIPGIGEEDEGCGLDVSGYPFSC